MWEWKYLAEFKNDGIKKEQSIKLLLVIVEKNGSTLHTPQHYFSTWFYLP